MATYAIRYIELPNGDKCDLSIFGSLYVVCSTAAATKQKSVTVTGISTLAEGLSLRIKFTYAQDFNGVPTLNVNSIGAKNIKRNGNINASRYEWAAGDVLDLVYDGASWIIVNGGSLKIG